MQCLATTCRHRTIWPILKDPYNIGGPSPIPLVWFHNQWSWKRQSSSREMIPREVSLVLIPLWLTVHVSLSKRWCSEAGLENRDPRPTLNDSLLMLKVRYSYVAANEFIKSKHFGSVYWLFSDVRVFQTERSRADCLSTTQTATCHGVHARQHLNVAKIIKHSIN